MLFLFPNKLVEAIASATWLQSLYLNKTLEPEELLQVVWYWVSLTEDKIVILLDMFLVIIVAIMFILSFIKKNL